jgi:RNA polymerase sigma factor (sigma-70 family)
MTTVEFSYSLDKMSRSLKPFALRLTKNAEEANDLMQETLMKAFNNRDKFSDGTNLKAWMYTIMKNTFITNYQRMVRRNTFIDTTHNLHYLNTGFYTTENLAYSTFTMDDIREAIDSLSEVHRVPFMMHFRGYKYHEIADKLQIPIGTVKNRIHIARKELQTLLKNYQKRRSM